MWKMLVDKSGKTLLLDYAVHTATPASFLLPSSRREYWLTRSLATLFPRCIEEPVVVRDGRPQGGIQPKLLHFKHSLQCSICCPTYWINKQTLIVAASFCEPGHVQTCWMTKKQMKKMLRCKQCALAVVRRSQKFLPRRRPGAGRPKSNQLEMVTTFTYRPNLVKIDACNFELSW